VKGTSDMETKKRSERNLTLLGDREIGSDDFGDSVIAAMQIEPGQKKKKSLKSKGTRSFQLRGEA